MNIYLKPCPFCGGEALLGLRFPGDYPFRPYERRWATVSCGRCAARVTRAGLDGTEEGAAKDAAGAWNTRTPPSDWREARELLDQTHQPDSGNLTAAYLAGLADGKAEAWNTRAERTCRIRGGECDQCGAIIHEHANLYWVPVGEGMRTVEHRDVHYCPNCGAKVVEG